MAIFAVAHAVLLRPLPFPDQRALVVAWEQDVRTDHPVWEVSYRNFRDWQSANTTFVSLAAMSTTNWPLHLSKPDGPVVLPYAAVSASFFDVLATPPLLGRGLTRADDDRTSPPAVVLSHSVWLEHFAADPAVIGRGVTIDPGGGPRSFTVVGVMPSAFDFPKGAAAWLPLAASLAGLPQAAGLDPLEARDFGVLYAVGRLKPGVSIDQATADLDVIVGRLTRSGGADGRSAVLTPLPAYFFGPVRPALLALLMAGGLVLVLTCANLVGLLIAQLSARERELATQLALGARRAHLVRLITMEAAILTTTGLVCAALFAAWLTPTLADLAPDHVPRLSETTLWATTPLSFALACALAVIVTAGALPVFVAVRRVRPEILTRGVRTTGGGLGARRALVVLQTAMAMVLLVSAVLTVRSFHAVRAVDPGFIASGVVTFDVTPPSAKYGEAVNARFYEHALEAVRELPGVEAVAALHLRPLELGPIGTDAAVLLERQSLADPDGWRKNPLLNAEAVTPDYFRVMKIHLVRGRPFAETDLADSQPVIIVSETAARRLWPGENAIGKRLRSGTARAGEWQTVVGIVSDVRYRGLTRATADLYTPHLQARDPVQHFVAKTGQGDAEFLRRVRSAVQAIDPGAVVDRVSHLTELVERELAPWRFTALLLSALAALALAISIVGLYALLGAQVVERAREIGVRIALGASRKHIIDVVIVRAVWTVGLGLLAGLAGSVGASRLIQSLLFGVDVLDPVTFVIAALLLGTGAIVGAYWPVRRALSVDPIASLRKE
jgi:predicted permease